MSHEKSEIRDEFLRRRRAIPAEIAADCATSMLDTLQSFLPKKLNSLAGYAAYREEIPLWSLFTALNEKKVITALPYVHTLNEALRFRQWKSGDPLVKGAFGIREPEPSAPPVVPEVLVVPMIAFDRSGHRLGYGGGYYDRTIQQLRNRGRLKLAIGLAFGVQEAEKIPAEAHDEKLDLIITEIGVVKVKR